MVTHDDECDSCGTVGRTCRMRWPDGETREMCGTCERRWTYIWRWFCESQPRQANRVRAKANRENLARPDGGEPMTDGGQPVDGTDRRDPTDDPRACSRCGVHIGFGGDEYCDGCAREIGVKPPLRRCVHCGQRGPEEDMKPIDMSGPDEYYPMFEYLCPSCSGGESA